MCSGIKDSNRKESILRVSPRLVIGNAILAAVENRKHEIGLEYFVDYRERLNNCLMIKGHFLPYINTLDVLNTAYSVSPYLNFSSANNHGCAITINPEAIDKLKKKLIIYYKNLTPDWLLVEMKSIN